MADIGSEADFDGETQAQHAEPQHDVADSCCSPAQGSQPETDGPSSWEIAGNMFTELEPEAVHVPSVVTFGGKPAAMDGDLVYLGGGIYASATQAKAAPPARKKPERRRKLLPGAVRPGRTAAVSASRSSKSAPEPVQRDEFGFAVPPPEPAEEKLAVAKTGPPPWRAAGAAKLPKVTSTGRVGSHPPPGWHEDSEAAAHTEGRAREREAIRKEGGASLFGRHGMLREIAAMQMPAPYRPPGLVGAPSNSDLRAQERRAAKEARVNAILQAKAERESLSAEAALAASAPNGPAAYGYARGLGASASTPVLPSVGLSIGLGHPGPAPPEDVEKAKLRIACKMETLAFLNGYHSAVGRMTTDQKASLLAKLHSAKPSRAAPAPALATPMEGKEADWHWQDEPGEAEDDEKEHEHEEQDEEEEEAPSIQSRLQHMNDVCNQAFDDEFDF